MVGIFSMRILITLIYFKQNEADICFASLLQIFFTENAGGNIHVSFTGRHKITRIHYDVSALILLKFLNHLKKLY